MSLQELKERKELLNKRLEEADNKGNFMLCIMLGESLNKLDRLIREYPYNKED